MRSKRVGIGLGLLALAIGAVMVMKRFRSAAVPAPAAARETQPVGSVFGYEIAREYPHDANAYTQGLIYSDGLLYESTGITGRSSLAKGPS
jgi:glutamine cyclotransferase